MLTCPFCRTRAAGVATEGYSTEPGLLEGEARYMGLWRAREIGVCDHCGERWATASRGIVTPCPSCGADHSGLFGYGVQRNCWECGTIWKSSPPARPKSRLDRLGEAIMLTLGIGFFLFIGGTTLLVLAAGVVFIYFAPILLVPLGLIVLVVAFFYFWTPSKRRARPVSDDPPNGP